MKISLLVPTRLRPLVLERMIESAFNKAENKSEIDVVCYIDEDDGISKTKIHSLAEKYSVKEISGPRIVLSEMWNACARVSQGEILMHCGDDVVFQTSGWDIL